MQELIDAVRAHAHANYNRDGWDYLVECWDDEYIARTIGTAKTAKTRHCGVQAHSESAR
jgi:hypothetical protein